MGEGAFVAELAIADFYGVDAIEGAVFAIDVEFGIVDIRELSCDAYFVLGRTTSSE